MLCDLPSWDGIVTGMVVVTTPSCPLEVGHPHNSPCTADDKMTMEQHELSFVFLNLFKKLTKILCA